MRERIVYRHPKGRFEVIERSGTDIFGNLYHIREAQLTPEKDERGLLTNAAMPAPVLWDRPEPQQDKPKTMRSYLTDEAKLRKPRPRRAWTDEDREEARRLYASGMTLHQVGEAMGRTFSAVKHAMEKKTG